MLSLKAPSQNQKKQLRQRPVKRKDVSRATGSVGGGKGSRRKLADPAKKADKGGKRSEEKAKKAKKPKAGEKKKQKKGEDAGADAVASD